MPMTPETAQAYGRVLTYAEKLLSALEELDDAGGLKSLAPGQAAKLAPLLADIGAECQSAGQVLGRLLARPARRGLSRRPADRPGGEPPR